MSADISPRAVRVVHVTGPSGTGKTAIVKRLASAAPCTAINSDKFYLYRDCRAGSLVEELEGCAAANLGLFGVLDATDPVWLPEYFVAKVREVLKASPPQHRTIIEGCSFSYNAALAASGVADVSLGLRWRPGFDLPHHLESRTRHLIAHGLLEETEHLIKSFGTDTYLLKRGVYYKSLAGYLSGQNSLESAIDSITTAVIRIALDQLARYEKVAQIKWVEVDPADVDLSVSRVLTYL
jgi:tRNA A37 N6-isopentenylltransferase MiaA